MPAPTNYTPTSTFWTTITNLVDTTLVTAELLYRLGINKVADRTEWLRDEIVRQSTRLQSSTAGTHGVSQGSVDLSTLTYDPTAGSLNGKTFGVESNSNAATITFGTGSGAPTSPADVIDQINAATASDPLATLDGAGKLVLTDVATSGSSSNVEVITGNAMAILGLTVGNGVPGVATGNDGASHVGIAAITGLRYNLSSGTVRDIFQAIADGISLRASSALAVGSTSDQICDPDIADLFFLDTPTVNTVASLKSTVAPIDGSTIEVECYSLANGRTFTVKREGGTTVAVITGVGGACSAGLRFKWTAGSWRTTGAWATTGGLAPVVTYTAP